MARIQDLQLRDVRCFDGPQSVRLGRRITLLVGENSTGKSTFMGCYKSLAKLASLHDLDEANHFDDPPFCMGSFRSIVRSGKACFTVGATFEHHCHRSASFTFKEDNDQPVDQVLRLRIPGPEATPWDVRVARPEEPDVALRFSGPGFRLDFFPGEITYHSVSTWLSRYVRHGHIPFAGKPEVFRDQTRGQGSEREQEFVKFRNFLATGFPFPDRSSFLVKAIDPTPPVRARSYPALPEHLSDQDDTELFGFLSDMGRKLGLWRKISTGKAFDSAPLEIYVEMPDGWRNLVDVGYGVHSFLPLLSAICRQPRETVFLLQQPEVHIHPRAQAGLAQWMAESERSFMIETHSDHLVDRFRICVMKEILAPEDLSIVYFEPRQDRTGSRIHSISVDALGNLEGEPEGYRSFFLNEAHNLLGFE